MSAPSLPRERLDAELARAYHDAALAAADMRRLADALVPLRDALLAVSDDLDARREIDDAIGRQTDPEILSILMALRQRLAKRIDDAWVVGVQTAFVAGPAAGEAALRERFVAAFNHDRLDTCSRLAEAEYAGLAADSPRRQPLREIVLYARVEAWPHAAAHLARLAEDERLPARARSDLTITLGEIELYFGRHLSRARQLFDRAVDLAPDFAPAQMGIGEYLLEAGDLAAARTVLERAAATDPRAAEPCLLLGDVFDKEGKFDLALDWYREGLRRQPGSASPSVRLMRLWGRNIAIGEGEDPLAALVERAGHVEPLYLAWACREAGYACQGRDLPEPARDWFRRAADADPENPNGCCAEAYLEIELGDYESAGRLAQQAIDAAPYAAAGYLVQARIGEDQRRWDDAGRAYREASARTPGGDPYLLAKAAQMAWRQDGNDAAVGELLELLRADPANEAVLGVVELVADDIPRERGDLARAIRLLDELRDIVGADYEARYRCRQGDLFQAAGDHAAAADAYRLAVATDPRKPLYYANLCRAWRERRYWGEAMALWKGAPAEVRADQNVRSWVGTLLNEDAVEHHDDGDYAGAVRLYRQSIEVFPSDAVVLSNLALALVNANDAVAPLGDRLDEAQAALRRAAEIDPANADYARRRTEVELRLRGRADYGAKALGRLPATTPIILEVAEDLIPLVTAGGDRLDPAVLALIEDMRTNFLNRYGVRLPGVRIRGTIGWLSGQYAVQVCEIRVGDGRVALDRRLCTASAAALAAIGVSGEPATPPVHAGEAAWIAAADWPRVTAAGLPLWSVIETPIRHLGELLEADLTELFGVQETANLIGEDCADLRAAVDDSADGLGGLAAVLRALLAERLSIAPLRPLCETYLQMSGQGSRPFDIITALRRLARRPDDSSTAAPLLRVGPQLTARLHAAARLDAAMPYLALPPTDCQEVLTAIRGELDTADRAWLVVEDTGVRSLLQALVELELPGVRVLTQDEPAAGRTCVGTVEIEA